MPDSREVPPADIELEPVSWREWQVVSDDGEGISFTIGVELRDAEMVATRWVRPGTHLALAEYRKWTSPTVLVSRHAVDARCPRDVGKRPSWMSPDQYDPCRCTLSAGHEPPCVCRHGEKSPAAATCTSTEASDGN